MKGIVNGQETLVLVKRLARVGLEAFVGLQGKKRGREGRERPAFWKR